MVIEFMEQFFNILLVGAIRKCDGFNKEDNKQVHCIVVLSGNLQIMCEFTFDTIEEQEKAYKELSKKIRKASALMVKNHEW